MVYSIKDYTRKRAEKIGVVVRPSTNKEKKIDVIKNNVKIASVGAIGYSDYPTYIQTKGIDYANKRRKLYKMRHESDRHERWTNGWLADQLLW
jgi:hypothetical protein